MKKLLSITILLSMISIHAETSLWETLANTAQVILKENPDTEEDIGSKKELHDLVTTIEEIVEKVNSSIFVKKKLTTRISTDGDGFKTHIQIQGLDGLDPFWTKEQVAEIKDLLDKLLIKRAKARINKPDKVADIIKDFINKD